MRSLPTFGWHSAHRSLVQIALVVVLSLPVASEALAATLPMPDHVVIVIEENHNFSQVIGSPSAPYINSLAAGGMSFTNMYAITHPSQPNYLEFFSGASQGVVDDTVPAAGVPFTTANLGAALASAGATFTGYSESQPSAGFTGGSFTTVVGQNQYVRKHNPWVNWQGGGVNQLSVGTNQPFASFPSDFTTLPKVSIVVPNEQNDMHDGTVAQGDTWLSTNLSAYATWAQTHNSLLIVTFDEDNGSARNRIPTIFYGPMMNVGTNANTHTLHDILRTVGDMYGASPSGAAANVKAITGVFTTDQAITTRVFQQGTAGYSGAHDTYIDASNPAAVNSAATQVVVDGVPVNQGLIRFDNLFGSGSNQVPTSGVAVVSAKLVMLTGTLASDASVDQIALNRMLVPWADGVSWGSAFGADGVQANGVEAASTSEFVLVADEGNNYAVFDVTDTISAWLANPSLNNGWVLRNISAGDGWRFDAAEFGTTGDRPFLEISFRALTAAELPEPSALAVGAITVTIGLGSLFGLKRRRK